MNLPFVNDDSTAREDLSGYVAQLQLHMSLQAKNLVPNLPNTHSCNQSEYTRGQLLHQTQTLVEKMTSRQTL